MISLTGVFLWNVFRVGAVEYLHCSLHHLVGNALRRGEIACKDLSFGIAEIHPCGCEHGLAAADVHHVHRLVVVFCLYIRKLLVPSRHERQVLIAQRVLLDVHVGVEREVAQREGCERELMFLCIQSALKDCEMPVEIVDDIPLGGDLL